MSVFKKKGARKAVRHTSRDERGAALILSIAITVVLFAIGVTFLTVSNVELQTATNVTNTVRVDLLADGANAIAIAHLNQDFFRNPEATSLDHSWRSYFSGAWAVGKPWAQAPIVGGPWLPEFNLGRLDRIAGFEVNIRFLDDNHIEPLFRGPRTASWAFVPRSNPNGILLYAPFDSFVIVDPLTDSVVTLADLNAQLTAAGAAPLIAYDPINGGPGAPQFNPFVVPNLYGPVPPAVASRPSGAGLPTDSQGNPIVYPAEAVNAFADIDNTGDGLRDSIWMPIPIDRFSPSYLWQELEIGISQLSGDLVVLDPAIDYVLFGIDNNLNGLIDEQPDNNIDHDGDGQADLEYQRNPDGSFRIDPVTGNRIWRTGPDGSPLPDIDEALEAGVFVYWGGNDGLDNNGNGVPDDPTEQKYFLTAPLPGIVIPVDLDGDGVPGDLVPDENGNPVPLRVQLPFQVRVPVFRRNAAGEVLVNPATSTPFIDEVRLGPDDVDVIDNDHNLIVNDYYTYAYIGPNTRPDIVDNGIPMGAPPFRHGGFEFVETGIGNWGRPIINETARNSRLPDSNTPNVLPAANDYESDGWQHPGNWLEEDKTLFAVPRRQSYRDINTTDILDINGNGNPNLRFIPAEGRIGDGTSNSIGNIGSINYSQLANIIRITHSGEPVTDIAGRAAIHIADESGKVNINTAGAYAYNSGYDVGGAPLRRSLNLGATTHEYEIRMLPGVDTQALSLQGLLSGSPDGSTINTGAPAVLPEFRYDISFPGYGRVDDNANAFFLAMTGIDNSGTGLIDDGLYLPRLSRLSRNALTTAVASPLNFQNLPLEQQNLVVGELRLSGFTEYYRRLGVLEGIDEPQERRPFNPYRNLLAEGRRLPHLNLANQPPALANYGNTDLDGDGSVSEVGELGDRILSDRRDWAVGGPANRATIARLTTTFSSDREIGLVPTREGYRALNRLDYNYATPQQIASALLINSEAAPVTTRANLFSDAVVRSFAEGLRRADTGVLAPQGILNGGSQGLPADPVLRALQTAADIVDMRDRDHRATRLTTENYDRVVNPTRPAEELAKAPWPPRALLNNRERIDLSEDPTDDVKLMPLEEIEQYLEDTYENIRRFHSPDEWWKSFVAGRNPDRDAAGLDPTVAVPEEKQISYTVQGREAIRINELMVRPVRRVEAETIAAGVNSVGPGPQAASFTDPMRTATRYSNFAPTLCLDGSGNISPCFNPTTNAPLIPQNPVMPSFDLRRQVIDPTQPVGPFGFVSGGPVWVLSNNDGILGDRSVLQTTGFGFNYQDGSVPPNFRNYRNILEFLIKPSQDGLPPGRYYLKINVQDANGNATVFDANQLEYAIKYIPIDANGQAIDTSLLPDQTFATLYRSILSDELGGNSQWAPVPEEWLSSEPGIAPGTTQQRYLGAPEGWAFLDGQGEIDANSNFPRYWLDGGTIPFPAGATDPAIPIPVPALGVPAAASDTHTVIVPPIFGPNDLNAFKFGSAPTPEQAVLPNTVAGFALSIAFRKAVDDGTPLAINFLDFSQEPNHEWVELANVSDEPVDVSGWRLEVGIPDRPEVPRDPHKSIWRIPGDPGSGAWEVAPGGKVLLSFGNPNDTGSGLTNNNGIGLAWTGNPGDPTDPTNNPDPVAVTVPPIADQSSNVALFLGLFDGTTPFGDPTGNVFWRPTGFLDYIDTNGDGVSMIGVIAPSLDNLTEPSTPANLNIQAAERAFLSELDTDAVLDQYTLDPNLEAFGRIIPMENEYLFRNNPNSPTSPAVRLDTITDVDTLAHFVLRGGVLPNYPEHDGIDNDGDNGYYLVPGDATTYVRGPLEKDMIDNNLSGVIDEIGEGIDEGRYLLNHPVTGQPWRQFGAGSYEDRLTALGIPDAGVMPIMFFTDRFLHSDAVLCLDCSPYSPTTVLSDPLDPTSMLIFDSPGGISSLGANPDPVFNNAVRRLGDVANDPFGSGNFITDDALYLGSNADPPDWKAFVERRWNPGDNVIVSLYDGDGGLADQATYREYDVINRTIDDIHPTPYRLDPNLPIGPGNYASLDPEYPSMWLPNHMNLDFYRSLERKHPLYAGDRFGTSNRWEATDGAYDDWAESMSWFEERTLLVDFPLRRGAVQTRFGPDSLNRAANLRLFSHAMYASPLRKNTAARLMENPADGVRVILTLQDDIPAGFPNFAIDPDAADLYGHFLPEPPANLWALAGANRGLTQFPTGDFFARDIGDGAIAFQDRDWSLRHPRNSILNRNYVSPGELTRLPHLQITKVLQNVGSSGLNLPFAERTLGVNPLNQVIASAAFNSVEDLQARIAAGTLPANLPQGRFDPSLRMGLLGQDTGSSDLGGVNLHQAATDTMATASIVLTVGQADFTPIGPFPADLPTAALPGGDVDELAAWNLAGPIEAPGLWTPVTYFEMPNFDLPGVVPTDRFPNYPTFYDGRSFVPSNNAAFVDRRILPLINFDWLFPGGDPGALSGASVSSTGAPLGNGPGLSEAALAARWPLEQRIVMYVAQNRSLGGGATTVQRAAENNVQAKAEAIWSWDANDGLENGEYILYIGTHYPGLADRLTDADLVTRTAGSATGLPELESIFDATGGDPYLDPRAGAFLAVDPESNNPVRIRPRLAIDVITDPSRARGVRFGGGPESAPGIVPPAEWNPSLEYRPRSDGYIFYGAEAEGQWRPRVVRVTNNFLAIRVRNEGNEREVGAISHVILAPRKRTPGKINVNTAVQTVAVPASGGPSRQFFNSLLGLPGVVDVSDVLPTATPLINDNSGSPFAPPIGAFASGEALPPRAFPQTDGPATPYVPDPQIAALQAMALMQLGLVERPDGRYYSHISELAREETRYGNPALAPNQPPSERLHPLSNQRDPERRFDEIASRFSRMSNLLTVRSDIFEIIVTVQSGYGIDLNGDGRFNYRSNDEFVTTAETSTRLVYERRTPADRSDEGRGRN